MTNSLATSQDQVYKYTEMLSQALNNDYVSSLVHELIQFLTFVNYDKKVHFSLKE